MKTLNFYHQKRKDGGLRTGVELNGARVLERFKRGRDPLDSALEWFVDVRCGGRRLPTDPEAARQWLLERSDRIGEHLAQMADELRAGIDFDWPLMREFSTNGDGVTVKIVCSAVRRLTGRDIVRVLLGVRKSWRHMIGSLSAFPAEDAA